MKQQPSPTSAKLIAIFRELVGDRAERLSGSRVAAEAMDAIGDALTDDYGERVAADIAFHLADWNADAAFIMAMHLFPERFSKAEIRQLARDCLIHAPNHLAAAAKLAGYPVQDVWELGVLDGETAD